MIYLNKRLEVITLSFFIIVSIVYPILSFFLFFLWMSDKNKFFGRVYVFLFLTLLIAINSTKHFENDLVWYYDHYQWIYYNGISNYFGRLITGVYAKISEPIMYFIFYGVGFFVGDNKKLFLIVFTFIPYVILLFAASKIFKAFNVNVKYFYPGVVFVLSLGLTFTLSVHLMRQFLAESLILLSLSYFFNNKKILPILLLFLAFFTHNSSAYIILIIFLSYISFKFINKNQIIVVFLTSTISMLCAYVLSNFLTAENQDYLYKDDGAVSILVYVLDVLLFLFCLLFFRIIKIKNYNFYNFYNFTICLFVINFVTLLGFINVPLLYLRFGFFSEIVRFLILCSIVKIFSIKFSYNYLLGFLMLSISFLYLYFRLNFSGFIFDINIVNSIFLTFFDI